MAYADPQDAVKSLLKDNWTAANTNNKTPEFVIIEDFAAKRYPMGFNNKDYVFIYCKLPADENLNGINNATAKEVTENVTIDIRSPLGAGGRSHFVNVVQETLRILDANIRNPSADFDYILPQKTRYNLSDKKSQIWREVIDIKLRRENVAIS